MGNLIHYVLCYRQARIVGGLPVSNHRDPKYDNGDQQENSYRSHGDLQACATETVWVNHSIDWRGTPIFVGVLQVRFTQAKWKVSTEKFGEGIPIRKCGRRDSS